MVFPVTGGLRRRLLAGLLLVLGLAATPLPSPLLAAENGGTARDSSLAATAAAAEDPAVLRQALEAAQAEYQQAQEIPAGIGPTSTGPASATRDELVERNHLLGELVAALDHQLDAAQRLPEASQHVTDQETRARLWSGFPTPPPYSILLVDQLREELDAAQSEIEGATLRAGLLDQQAEEEEKHYKAADIAARQSDERIALAQGAEERERQTWLRDLARLRARAAAANMAEAGLSKQLAGREMAEQRALAGLLQRQLDVARQNVRFSQADLDSMLATLDRQRAALEKRSGQLQSAGLQAHQALAQSQRQLAALKTETLHPGETAEQRSGRLALLERTADLRRLQADNSDLAHDVVRHMIDIGDWERTGWQFRWLLFNSPDATKRLETLKNLDRLVERLERWQHYMAGEITRAEQQDQETLADLPGVPAADQTALANEIHAAHRERAEILRNGKQAVATLLRNLSNWGRDERTRGHERPLGALLRDGWKLARHGIAALWAFELFTAQDSLQIDGRQVTAVRSITVGKSLGVILLVLAGAYLSKKALKIAKHLAVKHLRVSRGHANSLARWAYIGLLSALVIIALYLANIPLTVFAFLGGALAIGVGFGTQVLLKNMISGLMLLVERPLRVGDTVEVGTVVGTVTNISIRSSTVRTLDGIEILVPNSTFVENNVTNWTYSSARVRRSVSVGTDYSVPPHKVSALLLDVAARHPVVLKEPPPRVLLDDFGTDAIQFRVQYWIEYGEGTDEALVASELRFMIAEALSRAGIAIPFPQRVVTVRKSEEALL